MFKRATKTQARLRLALVGPAGSGKTYTALSLATALGRTALIDTERGSASKYADLFEFDACELEDFNPERYVEAIRGAGRAGYEALVIDSLSHAWSGKGGALELVDRAAKRSQAGNSYTAWREVTPLHNALVDAILGVKCHVIVTLRAKTEYVLEEDSRGKKVPRKVGMAPVQRDGVEYEFDVVGDLNVENDLIVSKTRCPALAGQVYHRPGASLAETLKAWLTDGVVLPPTFDPVAEVEQAIEAAETEPDLKAAADKLRRLNLTRGHPERDRLVSLLAGRGAALGLKPAKSPAPPAAGALPLSSSAPAEPPAAPSREPGEDEDEPFSDPTPPAAPVESEGQRVKREVLENQAARRAARKPAPTSALLDELEQFYKGACHVLEGKDAALLPKLEEFYQQLCEAKNVPDVDTAVALAKDDGTYAYEAVQILAEQRRDHFITTPVGKKGGAK